MAKTQDIYTSPGVKLLFQKRPILPIKIAIILRHVEFLVFYESSAVSRYIRIHKNKAHKL